MSSMMPKRLPTIKAVPPGRLAAGSWRGLVVDDDQGSRASARLALDGELLFGYPVKIEFASSAQQAKEILEKDSEFVFAILDVVMERQDSGLDLIDWIRSRPECQAMRLAIRTGYSGSLPVEEVIQKYDILDYRAKTELSRGKLIGVVAALARSWVEISHSMAGEKAMGALAFGNQELSEAQSPQYFLMALGKAGRSVMEPALFEAHFAQEPTSDVSVPKPTERWIRAAGLPDIHVAWREEGLWPVQAKAFKKLLSSTQASYSSLASIKKLEALAYSDSMTGLANRRRLIQWIERDLEAGEPLSVMIMDVDHFKRVNDRLGHEAGDKLLKALGERMGKACEAIPSRAARLGGDEFCVLFRSPSEADGLVAAKSWLDLLAGPIPLGVEEVVPKFSAGIAWSASSPPGEALRNADVAMYQAKKAGRGRLCRFDPSGFEQEEPKREREQRLAKGLADGELVPIFQPIVELSTGRCVALEMFARWRRGREGLLSAGDFLPMAHEAGVSKAIDLWMANQALEASVALDSRIQIRINIDSKQAADEAFADELCRLWSHAPDGAFAIEMLESAALPDLERVKRFASRLSASGVEMSLDGYGSGHASMGLLNKLDLGSVKVDASMTRGPSAQSGSKMGQSIAAVCAVHGIACMATGLESVEDVKLASSWGVTLGQGHLIAEPMPWGEIKKWLANSQQENKAVGLV